MLLLLSGVVPLPAIPPPWWNSRGVLQAGTTADDYAAANIGQLKNIATKAAAELDAQIPGQASPAIHALVNGWKQSAGLGVSRNDFAAVNIGQLKSLAEPFYTQLKAIHYTNTYPWTSTTADDNDYAAANIGQVKNLFSFDLRSTDLAHDVDQNGLPDWWERFYFGTIGVVPGGDNDYDGTTNLREYQAGTNPANANVQPKPAAPSNVVVTHNPDGSMDMTWQDNSDNESDFVICIRNKQTGDWDDLLPKVPANTEHVHVAADHTLSW